MPAVKLPKGGKLLRLDQAILCSPEDQRSDFANSRDGFNILVKPCILQRYYGLRGKSLKQINRMFGKFAWLLPPDDKRTDRAMSTQ